MLSRENPLSIEAVGEVEIDIDSQLTRLAKKIEEAERCRSTWIEKHRRLLEQRLGVRRKKSVPWPGANNSNWPITDAVIRRWKPSVANLVLRAEPVVHFDSRHPDHVERAQGAQEFYHWLFNTYMPRTALTVMELTDYIAQYGVGYTRQGWDYQTERHSRVVRADALFPQGIEPMLVQINQQIEQQNANLPEGQKQPLITAFDLVAETLGGEYGLNLQAPQEGEMVSVAAQRILDGARYVRLVYQSVVCDKPGWLALNPFDVVRPPRSEAIENDDYITVIHRMTADQIARKVQDGVFRSDAAAEVIQKMPRNPQGGGGGEAGGHKRSLLTVFDSIEGVQDSYSDNLPMAQIWEIYSKIDTNSDGIAERVVLWYDNNSKALLSAFEYPYPFREWPIVEFSFEHTSRRPYGSRGIAEMLSTFQRTTNTLHNARLDAAQITLAPMFQVRSIGNNFSRNIKFRPGARIPVNDPTDIEPIIMDVRPLVELLREETLTKTLAEQYVGIFDPSLSQVQGSGRERRTATEVEAVVSQSSEVQSQDAHLFQLGMAQVHRQLWDLWEDFGPEEVHYRVTGEEKPRLVKKKDLSGDYDIVPAGSPVSTNRALILARAREIIQFALQDQNMVIDRYEVWKEYFRSHDYQLAEKFVRTREEHQLLQETLQKLAEVEKNVQTT